jgi:hypothetical protein
MRVSEALREVSSATSREWNGDRTSERVSHFSMRRTAPMHSIDLLGSVRRSSSLRGPG